MRTPGERTSGAWTGGCVIHPDGGDETDRTAGNSYTATPHNTQRLDETQRAVDKMRVEKEPEALVKYPVQGSLYEHQVRAANMALLTFGLADPKEVLKSE